ncbi:leucine-rich repeat protein [Butyrivibrio sp. WCD2001]|uniref:leucine-rich repeat protein n=1 Tax=Butyrivibrio sp. WCD2001 TaxID=1280681 RepID=UPI00041E6C8B|nr:leucine-rich repeat protein [Butyrivibrio sp. WCD2001]
MRSIVKTTSSILLSVAVAFSMMITMPVLSFTSHAADTADVEFVFDDSSKSVGNFVLKPAFESYDKSNIQPIRFIGDKDYTQDYMTEADPGYDVFFIDCGLSGIIAPNYTDFEEHDAVMTVPIPNGYAPASLKMIHQFHYKNGVLCDYPKKVEATQYTDSTASVPVKLVVTNKSDTNDCLLTSHIYIELTKYVDISTKTASIPQTAYDYTGNPITPDVTIEGLTKDKDFNVTYADNTEPGTATVTITGKGIYKGSITLQFTINKKEYKQEEVKDEKTGASYEVSTNPDGTTVATYKAATNKKAKKISVPEKITLPDGTIAKVTQIAPKAFKDSKATQITIPKTVNKISAKAFEGSSAKKIIIKTDKKAKVSIGKGAFKKMKAKNPTILIKGCKGNAKKNLSKQVKKQASSGATVK